MGRYGGRKGFHSAPGILGVWCKGNFGPLRRRARCADPARRLLLLRADRELVPVLLLEVLHRWHRPRPDHQHRRRTGAETHGFFGDVVGAAEHGALFTNGMHPVLVAFAITVVCNVWFVYRGLSKGIETVCKYAMPVMAVLGIVILLRVLTLDAPAGTSGQTVQDGLGFLWNPDFDKLWNPKTWVAATGQIFFSLSSASRDHQLRQLHEEEGRRGAVGADRLRHQRVLRGRARRPDHGHGIGGVRRRAADAQATGGSMSLGFKTLPMVFAQMPGGNFFGAAFFLILSWPRSPSSLSMLQPTKAFFEEALGIDKKKSTTLVTIWGLLGNAFVLWYSKGLTALDTIDFWVGSVFIMVVAAVQIIAFGWIFGSNAASPRPHEGAQIRIPKFFQFVIKYVSPAYLIVILIGFCLNNATGYVETLRGNVTTSPKLNVAGQRDLVASFPAAHGDRPTTKLSYAWKQVDGHPGDPRRCRHQQPLVPGRRTRRAEELRGEVRADRRRRHHHQDLPVAAEVDVESPGSARRTWVFLLLTIGGPGCRHVRRHAPVARRRARPRRPTSRHGLKETIHARDPDCTRVGPSC